MHCVKLSVSFEDTINSINSSKCRKAYSSKPDFYRKPRCLELKSLARHSSNLLQPPDYSKTSFSNIQSNVKEYMTIWISPCIVKWFCICDCHISWQHVVSVLVLRHQYLCHSLYYTVACCFWQDAGMRCDKATSSSRTFAISLFLLDAEIIESVEQLYEDERDEYDDL